MMAVFALRARWRIQRGETAPDRVNPPKFTAFIGLCALLMGSTSLEALRFGGVDFGLPAGTGGILGNSLARAVIYYVGAGVSAVVFLVLMAIGIALLLDFPGQTLQKGSAASLMRKSLPAFGRTRRERLGIPMPERKSLLQMAARIRQRISLRSMNQPLCGRNLKSSNPT